MNYEAMLQIYVLRLSVVRLYVVRVLATFILNRAIRGMGNILHNSSILEYSGSTLLKSTWIYHRICVSNGVNDTSHLDNIGIKLFN